MGLVALNVNTASVSGQVWTSRCLSFDGKGDIRAGNVADAFVVLLRAAVVFKVVTHAVNYVAFRERFVAERLSIERVGGDGWKKRWDKIAELAWKPAFGESVAFDSKGGLCVAGLRVALFRFTHCRGKSREQHGREDAPSG
jgi:hypothetical protein